MQRNNNLGRGCSLPLLPSQQTGEEVGTWLLREAEVRARATSVVGKVRVWVSITCSLGMHDVVDGQGDDVGRISRLCWTALVEQREVSGGVASSEDQIVAGGDFIIDCERGGEWGHCGCDRCDIPRGWAWGHLSPRG